MKSFQRKGKASRWWYSYLMLCLLAAAVAGLSRAVWSVYQKERDSGAHARAAEEKLAALEARQRALEKKISGLKTREGVEAEIRSQFQVAKPGERMVVVVEKKDAAAPPALPTQSLLSRFFGIFR